MKVRKEASGEITPEFDNNPKIYHTTGRWWVE
jgi:hypothetical protein